MKKILIMIMVFSALVATSQAALIVDLSGDYQTCTATTGIQYVPLARPTTNTSAMAQFYENDFSTPIYAGGTTVSAGGSYTGKNIYGAVFQKSTSGDYAPGKTMTARMEKTDSLTLNAATTNMNGLAMNYNLDFMYVFKKADFINDLNTGSIGFDNNSTFAFVAPSWRADTKDARAVVLNGNTWYISLDKSVNAAQGASPITISGNASTCLWVQFDPLTSIDFDTINFSGTSVAGSTFTDIQAVGIYAHMTKTATGVQTAIKSIQIGGVVVPEPATVGMLGLGALVTLTVRRFRNR